MTTVNPEHADHGSTGDGPAGALAGVRALGGRAAAAGRGAVGLWRDRITALREALERPLTAYYLLLGASALLLVIGVIMVFSASSVRALKTYDDSYYLVKRQLTWVLLGLVVAWVASRLSERWLRGLVWIGYGVSVVLLVLVARFGTEVGGNKNWLSFGPVGIQPSEIAKLALVLWAAHVFALGENREWNVRRLIGPVLGMLVMIGLVLLGRDLGTALVFIGILVSLLWIVGVPGRVFAVLAAVMATGAFAFAVTSQHRVERLTTFLDPFGDYLDSGWQPAHGLFALSTGGWLGQGLGASSQKWGGLAEAHTDFIFAVIGEELGLAGTLLVLALFLAIAWAGYRVAITAESAFVRYASFGIVAWLMSQMIINVGMVVGLLPVIGIPLPLISYGGSALLPSVAALGLLVGFARRQPDAAAALAARSRGRSAGLYAGGASSSTRSAGRSQGPAPVRSATGTPSRRSWRSRLRRGAGAAGRGTSGTRH